MFYTQNVAKDSAYIWKMCVHSRRLREYHEYQILSHKNEIERMSQEGEKKEYRNQGDWVAIYIYTGDFILKDSR